MAQLVERLVRNEEASGSNPLISTKRNLNRTTLWRLGFSFFTHNYKIVLRAFLWTKGTLFIIQAHAVVPLTKKLYFLWHKTIVKILWLWYTYKATQFNMWQYRHTIGKDVCPLFLYCEFGTVLQLWVMRFSARYLRIARFYFLP